MNIQWWIVRVYDAESRSFTELNKSGELQDIIDELKEDGLWEFVSAKPEPEEWQ